MVVKDMKESLKKDWRLMDNIATETGNFLFENPETSLKERFFWAMSVTFCHLIESVLWLMEKQEKKLQ